MNLHGLLRETNNHFLDTIERMQKNGQPLVLLGAGLLAQVTWEFLNRKGFAVDYIAINRQYIEPGMTFNDLPVRAIEALIEEPQRYNYILAFNVVTEGFQRSLNHNAEEMLVFDPSFIGVSTSEYYTPEFCNRHSVVLNEFYHQLADEHSRETMVAFLNQRLSARRGGCHDVYEPAHYFPQDVVRLTDREVFIDCGAYNGDSIAHFMQEVEKQGVAQPERIIGFEPDADNFEKLKTNTQDLPFCQCEPKGVWHEDSILRFQSGNGQSSHVSEHSEGTISILLTSIDNTLAGDKATFIKMDIEGVELNALQGAEKTIRKCRPLLAISVYHKPDDLVTIPKYIKSLNADYQFYLRIHSAELAYELVLYAIPVERIIPATDC